MKEEFLSFIWRNQYFNKRNLRTEQGESINVADPGEHNTHSGPDFTNARLSIGDTNWAGQVEIHIRSSDWYRHNHHIDPAYDQVILHVVWLNDQTVCSNGREVPVLVLKNRVGESMLLAQRKLCGSVHYIPCEVTPAVINRKVVHDMLQRTIHQRLARKSAGTLDLLLRNNGDWDQVTYLMFGKSFGFHVNNEAFSMLVRSVPLSIARKIRSSLFQLEALYFGQAGLLGSVTGDHYYKKLQAEYGYLRNKYVLPAAILKGGMWKYLRLRPSNFPGLRIAQFASFMHLEGFRFSGVRELRTPGYQVLNGLSPSDYWHTHYAFGKKGGSGGSFGNSSCENLLINTAVPLLAAYAMHTGQSAYREQAEELLKSIPAEHNRILAYWKDSGFKVSSAWDSQALIELSNKFCKYKKCLDCEIGRTLLKASPV